MVQKSASRETRRPEHIEPEYRVFISRTPVQLDQKSATDLALEVRRAIPKGYRIATHEEYIKWYWNNPAAQRDLSSKRQFVLIRQIYQNGPFEVLQTIHGLKFDCDCTATANDPIYTKAWVAYVLGDEPKADELKSGIRH